MSMCDRVMAACTHAMGAGRVFACMSMYTKAIYTLPNLETGRLLANRTVLLQHGQQGGLLGNGQQLANWAVEQDGGPAKLTARLLLVTPCVIVAGQPAQLLVSGVDLAVPGVKLHARSQGRYLQVVVRKVEQPVETEAAAGASEAAAAAAAVCMQLCSVEVLLFSVPLPGLIWLEAEQQHLMCRAVPVLVVPDVACELMGLEDVLVTGGMRKVSSSAGWAGCRGWLLRASCSAAQCVIGSLLLTVALACTPLCLICDMHC
jgi:hypothetical protein